MDALVHIASTSRVVLVEEVYDELTFAPRKPEKAREAKARLDGVVTVMSIELGSAAATTLGELRRARSSTKDLGEDASIALAMHDDRLVFVTHEVRAVFDAVESLAPRVLTLHPFLRDLVSGRAIDRPHAARLSESILRAKRSAWPTPPPWWEAWATASDL